MTDPQAMCRAITYNAGATLRYTVERPNPANSMSLGGASHRVYTGMGKYTTLAAIGVFNCLKSNGLAKESGSIWLMTPLGVELGQYILANWSDARMLFRNPR